MNNQQINNSDVCKSALSAGVQTQILGIASGIAVTDENCERMKLIRPRFPRLKSKHRIGHKAGTHGIGYEPAFACSHGPHAITMLRLSPVVFLVLGVVSSASVPSEAPVPGFRRILFSAIATTSSTFGMDETSRCNVDLCSNPWAHM